MPRYYDTVDWLQNTDIGTTLQIFVILRIALLFETIYFNSQIRPSKNTGDK